MSWGCCISTSVLRTLSAHKAFIWPLVFRDAAALLPLHFVWTRTFDPCLFFLSPTLQYSTLSLSIRNEVYIPSPSSYLGISEDIGRTVTHGTLDWCLGAQHWKGSPSLSIRMCFPGTVEKINKEIKHSFCFPSYCCHGDKDQIFICDYPSDKCNQIPNLQSRLGACYLSEHTHLLILDFLHSLRLTGSVKKYLCHHYLHNIWIATKL